jgi:hypothetical protein
MSSHVRYEFLRLLNLFEEVWAESDAWRTARRIQDSGQTANRETNLQASRTRAQELFQPALSRLNEGAAVSTVVEQLLARLEKSRATEESAS